MKLAEILAEIMEEWPSTTKYYTQDYDRAVYPWVTKPHLVEGLWKQGRPLWDCIDHNPEALVYNPDLASDWDEALVTKEDWMRERIRLGKEEAVDKCCDSTQTLSTGGGTPGHIHAESMKLYAEDAAETEKPWERWQGCLKGSECWEPMEQSPAWHTVCEYRRKPTTITIGGEEVSEPVREPMEQDDLYWVTSMVHKDLAYFSQWRGDNTDKSRLRLGIVHRTKEAAVAHAKALIKVSGGEV